MLILGIFIGLGLAALYVAVFLYTTLTGRPLFSRRHKP